LTANERTRMFAWRAVDMLRPDDAWKADAKGARSRTAESIMIFWKKKKRDANEKKLQRFTKRSSNNVSSKEGASKSETFSIKTETISF